MKITYRILALIIALCLALPIMAGCAAGDTQKETTGQLPSESVNEPDETEGNDKAETNISIAEFVFISEALAKNGAVSDDKYTITGTVIEIRNTEYGNIVISDGTTSVLIYGTYDATGALRFDAMQTQPKVGEIITVFGVASYYNGAQMKNGWILSIKPGDGSVKPPQSKEPAADAPVGEILEYAYTLPNKATTNTVYTLQGVITRINSAYNPKYGNISITILIDSDEAHPIFCYRLVGDDIADLKVGDKVTVQGKLNNYSNIIQLPEDSVLLSYDEGEAPKTEYTTYIRFDDLANRIEWVKAQQVWTMNGVKVVNSKDNSTVDASNTNAGRMPEGYYSPIRCYTGAGLSVEYEGMTKLEFICYNVNYTVPFANSPISGGTLTVNGDTVTVVFDEPTDYFKISDLTAQIQVSQINIYAE